jgi:hypothetical protein
MKSTLHGGYKGDSLPGAELSQIGCCGDTCVEGTTADKWYQHADQIALGLYTVCETCVHGYIDKLTIDKKPGEATEMLRKRKTYWGRRGWQLGVL